MRALPIPILAFLALLGATSAFVSAKSEPTIEDLKKLEITCFVPAYLPKGFRLTSVGINQEEDPSGQTNRTFPLYSLEYAGPNHASFSVESAREGIGDRNLMETEDSEEKKLHSPIFGPVYIIYMPKGPRGSRKRSLPIG